MVGNLTLTSGAITSPTELWWRQVAGQPMGAAIAGTRLRLTLFVLAEIRQVRFRQPAG